MAIIASISRSQCVTDPVSNADHFTIEEPAPQLLMLFVGALGNGRLLDTVSEIVD